MALLAACVDSSQSSIKEYIKRVANVLELDLPSENQSPFTFPRLSQLTVYQPKSELSIREFMSMRQCKLHSIIADKNSQMGKVAPVSQVLFNDLAILQNGPDCVEQLRLNDQLALANKLDDYLNQKSQVIETIAWHAIFGSSENAKFWSVSNQVENYPYELIVDPAESIRILLAFIEDIKNNRYLISAERESAIEQSLQALSFADGGLLLQRLLEIDMGLAMANSLIQQGIDNPVCFANRPNQKANYLKNVVLKFFIGQVQPDLVDLLKRYQQLMPSYLEIEESLSSVTPATYRQWQGERQQLFEQARTSAKRHVEKLLVVFAQCGLSLN